MESHKNLVPTICEITISTEIVNFKDYNSTDLNGIIFHYYDVGQITADYKNINKTDAWEGQVQVTVPVH